MGRLKAVVTDHVFASFEQERAILGAAGIDVEVLQCKEVDALLPRLSGVHGLLNTYMPGIDRRVFDAASELQAVVRYGIGVDTIDIAEATRRGILVANVPDYCIDEVADHALAHFLALARKLVIADRCVKGGAWSLSCCKPLPAIRSMRVGVIGFGRIGRAIASRLCPFGCEVVFFDPCVADGTSGCSRVSMGDLLAGCHAIFVQCPASAATHHLLDDAAFEAMEQRPLVINCARGEIVDSEALVRALHAGLVSGAGLDVVEDEEAITQGDRPLTQLDNVLLTPHSAWYSDQAIPMLQRRAAETLAALLTGARPESLLNPEATE